MRLKYKFSFIEVGDSINAVPIGDNASDFNAILTLNDVAAKMLQYISECSSEEEVYQKLLKDYPDDDKDDIKEKLDDFILQCKVEGMLED